MHHAFARGVKVTTTSALRTPICDLFGIDVPIILAGMGGVSMAPLVAAVSNAGGLGVMGAAALSPDDLRAEIRKVRELTSKPFAVDLLAPLPQMLLPYLPVLYDEGVKIFVAGLAVPEKQVPEMKRHGMKIMVMTGKVQHALRAEAAGADVVAAQGTEAGGHTGEIGTLALVPQVVDAVKIPVVAAGGIVDGRGVVAALALGAQGAVIGTRFIATPEASVHENYKQAVLKAEVSDSTLVGRGGHPLRLLKNLFSKKYEAAERAGASDAELEKIYSESSLKQAALNGDVEHGRVEAGQSAGLVEDIVPAGELVRRLAAELEQARRRLASL